MLILWLLSTIVFADLRTKINSFRAHLQKQSPNEDLADILFTAEGSLDAPDASNYNGKGGQLKKNSVVPQTINHDLESPLYRFQDNLDLKLPIVSLYSIISLY